MILSRRGDGYARGYVGRRPWAVGAAVLAVAFTATAWAASVTYVYDEAAGRLKQVLYDDGARVTYTLDAAGNRTQVASAAATPVTTPTGLTAQPASDNSVAMSWTPSRPEGTGQPVHLQPVSQHHQWHRRHAGGVKTIHDDLNDRCGTGPRIPPTITR